MSSPSAQSSDDEPTGPGSQVGNPAPEASTSYAPYKSIPKAAFASIEYPSTVSHPAAILRLVNQEDINECFNAPSNEPAILEMRLGSMHRSGVPIRGSRVQSQKLLLKLTRRRRRRPEDADETGGPPKGKERERDGAEMGVFTSEVVGPIPHTVRFRGEPTLLPSIRIRRSPCSNGGLEVYTSTRGSHISTRSGSEGH
jgi:general transcription factor 3C polypeptide 5 (transcription factor C subunit 1)